MTSDCIARRLILWSLNAHRFPLLVEYAGNGDYANAYGDTCSGRVEDCNLGYGLSAGAGFLWLCLPTVRARANRTVNIDIGKPIALRMMPE